jgi:predicted RNase H-like nuclease (RuvC/YqgF family)
MEQKRAAVERMSCCGHKELAAEIGIPQRQLYSWRRDVERWQLGQAGAEQRLTQEQRLQRENQRLKQALAGKVVEVDFLRGALRRIEARRQHSSAAGETASTSKSE